VVAVVPATGDPVDVDLGCVAAGPPLSVRNNRSGNCLTMNAQRGAGTALRVGEFSGRNGDLTSDRSGREANGTQLGIF
jgi:hypothetical protein